MPEMRQVSSASDGSVGSTAIDTSKFVFNVRLDRPVMSKNPDVVGSLPKSTVATCMIAPAPPPDGVAQTGAVPGPWLVITWPDEPALLGSNHSPLPLITNLF